MSGEKGGHGLKCILKDIERLNHDDIRKVLEIVKIYVEDSHFSRKLYKCKECGQLYMYEFTEDVDYVGRNDAMYYRYIPVKDEVAAELLSQAPQLEVECSYGIHVDWPKDAESQGPPYWANIPKPTRE